MEFTWFGAAAFRVKIGSSTIWLDPYLSRMPSANPPPSLKVEEVTEAQYVFLSHGHMDHASDTPTLAQRTGARIFAPSAVCDTLRRQGVPDRQMRPLQGIETLGFNDFRVRTIPASHIRFDAPLLLPALRRARLRDLRLLVRIPMLHLRHPMGAVMSYLFTTGAHSFLFCGSAGYSPDTLRGLEPDLALVPLQGRSDIHQIVAEMVACIAPRWVIPHHYDDFLPPLSAQVDPMPFVTRLKQLAPQTRVYVPKFGETIRFERGELL
jgi:L-ascorbate metabolism protein UlaG (beta-lactamase superfamily)